MKQTVKRGRGRPSMRHLTCSVRGCNKPHRAKGLCSIHYQKHRRKQKKERQTDPSEDFLIDCIDMKQKMSEVECMYNERLEAIMAKKDKKSSPNKAYTNDEVRAILRAIDRVEKNPGPGVKTNPKNLKFWEEVSTILWHDSDYHRGAGALKSWYNKRQRDQRESDTKPGGPLAENYTQIGHEVQDMRDDISEILTEMAGIREFRESVVASVDDIRQTLRDISDLLTAGGSK